MDTTPGLETNIQALTAQRLQLPAERFVAATPSAAAPASANCCLACGLVSLVRCRSTRLAGPLGLRSHDGCSGTAGISRDETAARKLLGHGKASGLECSEPEPVQVPQAQNVRITLSILEPTSMTERPITVRQHFQALRDMATSSDKELTDDKAASLFAMDKHVQGKVDISYLF